jgi:membrane protein DedA with SNARE-associated domain
LEIAGAFATFSATYGVLAVFVIMLLKETGVPVPIPSDLVMIGAGIQIAAGSYSAIELLIALTVAVLVGSSIQFVLARTAGRALVYRLGGIVGLRPELLDRAIARIAAGGTRAVVVGLNIPGARAAVVPAAGLSRFPFLSFTLATVAGSLFFYGWHVALGYVVGPAAIVLLERYSAALIAAVVVLAVAGLGVWLVLRRRARDAGAVRSWTDAACPACLAITALRSRDAPEPRL